MPILHRATAAPRRVGGELTLRPRASASPTTAAAAPATGHRRALEQLQPQCLPAASPPSAKFYSTSCAARRPAEKCGGRGRSVARAPA